MVVEDGWDAGGGGGGVALASRVLRADVSAPPRGRTDGRTDRATDNGATHPPHARYKLCLHAARIFSAARSFAVRDFSRL